ncbi:transporter, Zip family-related protein [Trichomonas vaginalis G3]|uniref:Transporter, Zip family-related protein n=1 Tax=Trichomonas vaginalis (strain ATCC PRA-98 / G3) TaxID=412133 RepID=A2DVM4_TRIV3|nr:zinc ion transmembrane transporter protein [Trichomonas vaginalis G3]EAY15566.1 transporter, Zip family-related protein [Trichomonas vaginalis G3]KAI5526212.1 zinc ion transmembrane transporter protein [Trichomonas vaginalis G3]|eukprot:XP_001327789.1 transporter, Zip family-related protein [Trichomonas vaginalis G3]
MFTFGEHDASQFHINANHNANEGNSATERSEASPLEEDEEIKEMFSDKCRKLSIPTISLYIIMCIHSITAGLALGILKKLDGVIAILCAIVGHKPVEAFAISLVVIKERPHKFLFWPLIIFYTLMTPLGIIVGILVVEFVQNNLALGIVSAFSAGTFLFVGAYEWSYMVADKGQLANCEKLWHFLMFFIGVVWMLLIALVETLSPEEN